MIGIESICASLALEHHALDPKVALRIIDIAKVDDAAAESALFLEVTEDALLRAIAAELDFTYINLSTSRTGIKIDPEVQQRADPQLLRDYSALPMISPEGDTVVVVANPTNPDLTQYLQKVYGNPKILLGSRGQIQSRLAVSARPFLEQAPDNIAPAPIINEPIPLQSRNPIVQWVDGVLEQAVAQDASDIHFEFTDSGRIMLRLRIDGLLRAYPSPLRNRESEVIGIIMNRSGMDTANQREPQDGAFSFTSLGRKIDVRAGMLPQVNGTTVVLRLLDSNNVHRRLIDMGFSQDQLEQLMHAIHAPQGTIVVCGPTGSGKTTTLYALVREVATIEKNVTTIEDPVEYRLPLVNQTAVTHTSDGRAINFARALRSIMRVDPDVILVGEIRDTETARTAMDAAITGHLVLSTVHARNAVGIYTRLTEMGVPNYLVADAMTLGVSQRLARRLHSCAEKEAPTELEVRVFQEHGIDPPAFVRHPVGCDGCGMSGYAGRVAVVEVLNPTKEFRRLVLSQAGHDELTEQAIADGFIPMVLEGLRLVLDGTTTVAEVLRVVELS